MALPNASYFDNIRHTLYCVHKPPLVITDPIGYEESNEEFSRTIQNIGIVGNFSTALKFVNNGLDYIEDVANNYGLNEAILIKKEGRNFQNDEWEELYISTLDLSTYEVEDGILSIKINSGGVDKVFKARESDKLEIEGNTTVDGKVIPKLITKKVSNDGRDIFLKTIFDVTKSDNNAYMYNQTKGNTRGQTVCVPLHITSKSHDNAQSPTPNTTIDDHSHERNAQGTNGLMFFANADKKRNLDINLKGSFTPNVINYDDINWSKFWLRIAIYKDGASYNYSREEGIWFTQDINNYKGKKIDFKFEKLLSLNEGESASLQFSQLMDGKNGNSAHLEIKCENIVAEMAISEKSTSGGSETEMILMHELGERLSLLITGKDGIFKSNILGRRDLGYKKDGDWAYLATYSGHWLRGFSLADETKEDNRYRRYTTSFKDFSETLRAILNVHVGFQTINGKEQVVAEEFNYFFNPNIVLVLPNPLTKVKRYVAEDFIYSSVESGYEKGGEVEEIQGLDEPNGKANWLSNMTTSKSTYTALSKYIAGVYAEEKQRRYPKKDYPTLDRNLDKDIFIKDCKLQWGSFKERVWRDDFAVPPKGIFSPDTTKNLRLSPANNLRRHGALLATPLKHYQDKFLAFGSSTSNSGMITQPGDFASQVAENGNVLNSKLGNRIFEPFYIEGEHFIDTKIAKLLRGHSKFNGIETPNFYCKVQFTLENDPKIRYGWLMSVKPDGAGKWKFIEASN